MEHEVTTAVNAPPDRVWRLFIDVERWPTMTRSMREVRRVDEGPLRVGSEAMVDQPGLLRARWRVTAVEPGRSFTWETSAAGVTSIGEHIVDAAKQGSTVTLRLRQRGPLAGVVGALVRRRVQEYLAMEIDGFRATAESGEG